MARLVEPKTIIRRLTPTAYKALEAAVSRAGNARAYEVTVEHMLLELADKEDGDLARILHQYDQDRGKLVARLQKVLDRMRVGNAGKPMFSESLFQWFEESWTVASLETDSNKHRTGALVYQYI